LTQPGASGLAFGRIRCQFEVDGWKERFGRLG
jgi:hypothetical protein